MKKFNLYLIALCFSFAFTACNSQVGQEQEKQEASSADSVRVKAYPLVDIPLIDTFAEIAVFEGGFSGLSSIPGKADYFYTINDRGPNVKADKHPKSQGKDAKLFPFQDYEQKIIRIKKEDGIFKVDGSYPIQLADGRRFSGLAPDLPNVKSKELIWGGEALDTLEPHPLGVDLEGIAIDQSGFIWICEEYRPAIFKLSPKTFDLTAVYSPQFTDIADHTFLDSVLLYRRPNRGFEGITVTPEGKIVAVLQSPLQFPDAKKTRLLRILSLEPRTGESEWFFYEMEAPKGDLKQKNWKVGSIAAINENEFLLLEHGAKKKTNLKYITKINLAEATPVPAFSIDIYEKAMNAKGLQEEFGVKTVEKTLFLDLKDYGWDEALEKAEGLTIINDSTILVINDNDYALSSPQKDGTVVDTEDPTMLYKIHLPKEKRLQYRPIL